MLRPSAGTASLLPILLVKGVKDHADSMYEEGITEGPAY